MSNNKQSSLQWLTMTLSHLEVLRYHGGMKAYDYLEAKTNAMIQAKAMHKEEMFEYIKQKYWLGEHSLDFHKEIFEKWYNETFGGNE